MTRTTRRACQGLGSGLLILLLAACASSPRPPAPVESRAPTRKPPAVAAAPAPVPAAATAEPTAEAAAQQPLPPGAENAGKPGYYTVRPGDTMIRIGLEHGQNWRDIVRWNGLENPSVIEVGQVLRVVPPAPATTNRTAAATNGAAAAEGRAATSAPVAGAPATPATAATAPPATPAAASTPPAREPDDEINWMWPASGPVAGAFDDSRNKGLAILGNVGDPVVAAADGRVVYSGAGLRGYGNLVIVKHNNTYLSAYAHNQTLLVKEDQVVRRGQKIAEMGATDADRVQLHFEIRRQGRPVDPARLLPPR